MEFLYLFTGLALGFVIAWLLLRSKQAPVADNSARLQELDRETAGLKAQLDSAQAEKVRMLAERTEERERLEKLLHSEREQRSSIAVSLAHRETEAANLEKRLSEQKQELEQLQKRFTTEFENLANRIFEEKSQKFTEQNKTSLDDILKPLNERIKDFEKKVTDVYVSEAKERASLKEQVVQLHQLNQQMSRDAQNLTKALKGESKTQGNWGEFILESILEKSGLVRDREFTVQTSFVSEDGRRQQPDVVINLPEGKHIIVDSKVTLTAYERYVSAEQDTDREMALREHVASLRKHIRDLSEKNYQKMSQVNSPDFVFLFIPLEPAATTALQADNSLFDEAFSKNIVIVNPATLLSALRIVYHIWQYEKQNRNAKEIANYAGSLYEKFAGFIDAMRAMGKKIDESKEHYELAMNRLTEGRGNLVRQIERLKEMGAKTSSSIHPEVLKQSGLSEPLLPEETTEP